MQINKMLNNGSGPPDNFRSIALASSLGNLGDLDHADPWASPDSMRSQRNSPQKPPQQEVHASPSPECKLGDLSRRSCSRPHQGAGDQTNLVGLTLQLIACRDIAQPLKGDLDEFVVGLRRTYRINGIEEARRTGNEV
jgi:hypothetical protein